MIPPPPPPPHFHPGHPENGSMPPVYREPPSPFLVGMSVVNTVTQLLLGAIACCAFIFANLFYFSTSFNRHIYLCVTGYIILMSQAVLTISPYSWSSPLKHEDKRTIHWAMQILGSVLAIAGSIARIADINSHFQSAHGAFGIIALIFTCLSLAGGVINLFFNKFNPNFVKIGHACFGSLTLVLAFLALIFGFDKDIFRTGFNSRNTDMLIAFSVFALIGTLAPACVNMVQRLSK